MKYLLVFFLISCALEKTKTPAVVKKHVTRVLTIDNLSDFEGNVLQYVMDAPQLKEELGLDLQKNRELCKQGHDSNCEAIDQLKKDREDLHLGMIDITWVKGCSTHAAIQEWKSLTRKVDPQLMRELKVYREAYKREAGHELK